MAGVAPYANTAIPLYLTSLTGMRYRTLSCVECGRDFLERDDGIMRRIGDDSQPGEIAISSEMVTARCGECQQLYHVNIAISISLERDSVALYLQPESIYLVAEASKKMRSIHCLECGKTFHVISDRISQISDNRVPYEYFNPIRLGPVEIMCNFNKCSQTWALMV